MNPRVISEYFHKRGALLIAGVLLVVTTIIAWNRGAVSDIPDNRGLALPSANLWLERGEVSMWLNLALTIAAAAAIAMLNRSYNVMRSMTLLWSTALLLFQIATPMFTGQFYGGTLMCLVMLAVIALMYSMYMSNKPQRRVLLIFAILSTAAMCQYAFMFLIPVAMVGIIQMRVFSLRTFLAAGIGIVTPPWILFGTGLVSLDAVHWPRFVSLFSVLDRPELIQTFCSVALTIVCGILFLSANIMKMLSYNARFRAYNGFLSVLMIAAMLLTVADWENFAVYVPLLNMTVAFQIAMFFSNNRKRHSYISLLIITISIISLYIWAMLI